MTRVRKYILWISALLSLALLLLAFRSIYYGDTFIGRKFIENRSPSSSAIVGSPHSSDFVDKVKSKGEMISYLTTLQNTQPQDFYGKVVDQQGSPVVNVDVTGTLMLLRDIASAEERSVYKTRSDEEGNFQFTNLHGWRFAVSIQKDGYEVGEDSYKAPNVEDTTSLSGRAIFTIWKLKGAEPIIHKLIESTIPYNGTLASFDPIAGSKDDNGDLKVSLLRGTAQVRRGIDKYDWKAQITLNGGGLVEAPRGYQNLAPNTGYLSTFEFSEAQNDPSWTPKLTKIFYVHMSNGTFGKIKITLWTDYDQPETAISIESWINPSGSKNLELDPAKEINP